MEPAARASWQPPGLAPPSGPLGPRTDSGWASSYHRRSGLEALARLADAVELPGERGTVVALCATAAAERQGDWSAARNGRARYLAFRHGHNTARRLRHANQRKAEATLRASLAREEEIRSRRRGPRVTRRGSRDRSEREGAVLSATLSADDCIAYSAALWTAAMVGGGLQMGLSIPAAGLTFPPFVRGQAGQMQSGDERFGVSGFAGGLTIARKL